MVKIFLTSILLLFCLNLNSQNFKEQWSQVIQLESDGSIRSALEEVDKIYAEAKEKKLEVQIIKSFFFRSKYLQVLEEEGQSLIVENLKSEIQTSSEPGKSLLEYIYVSCLDSYYQRHKYQINRRNIVEGPAPADFKEWTQEDFKNKFDSVFQNTFKKKTLLTKENLYQFELILNFNSIQEIQNKNVYEFLLRKHFDLFHRNLKTLEEDISLLSFQKEKILGKTSEFLSLPTEEVKSRELKNLIQILQELEKERPTDENLVYKRLQFFENTVFNDPKEFLRTLNSYQQSIKDTALLKKVQLARAELYSSQASKEHFPENYSIAIKILDSILQGSPRSNTYKTAYIKKAELEFKQVNIQMEEYISSQSRHRAYVSLKNTDSLFLYFFKVPNQLSQKNNAKHPTTEEKLLNNTPFKSAAYKLPHKNDFFTYSTEILLPQLPIGTYLVYFSPQKLSTDNLIPRNHSYITVTDLSILHKDGDNKDYYQVVNRNTGQPIPKAEIILDDEMVRTKKNGTNKIKRKKRKNNESYQTVLTAVKGSDSLSLGYYKYFYSSYDHYNDDEDFPGAVKIYTDRGIYRPGQKVYVKGIAIKNKNNVKSVVPKLTVLVEVVDPNGKTIKEQELITNEYGSFIFEFIIPKNGITGEYSIQVDEPDDYEKDPYYSKWRDEHKFWDYADFDYSETSFRVEEYKRPTFKIEFDSLNKNYVLNEKVIFTGLAESYSGVPLSDSKVKYRIERKNFPDYGHYYSHRKTLLLDEGEVITGKEGKFSIEFDALPDPELKKLDLPVFYYTIYTDVTDSRGETQSAEKSIKLGYHNLKLSVDLPSEVNTEKGNTLKLKSFDLNGGYYPIKGKVEIFYLSPFSNKFKDRIFPEPEIPGFTKEEFEHYFPNEKYSSKEDERKGTLIFSKDIDTKNEKEIVLDFLNKENSGRYKVVFSAEDSEANLIETQTYFSVVHNPKDKLNTLFTVNQINAHPFKDGFVEVEIHSQVPVLYMNVSDNNNPDFAIKQVEIKDGHSKFKIPINKKRTEAVRLTFQTYFDNQFFSDHLTIEKQQAGELEVTTQSFVNKIEPGSKHTWSFTISQQDRPISAEVLASMYDSSLDQFFVKDWEALDLPNYYYGGRYYSSISNLSNEKKYVSLKDLNPHIPKFHFTREFVDLFWFGFNFNSKGRFVPIDKLQNSAIPSGAFTVIGTVTDDTGLPLPGVNVIVKGTSRGTRTDFDGYYSIEVAPGEDLEFSYVGFDAQTVTVRDSNYDISLEAGSALEEVVVTGYSAEKQQAQMTSAIVNVSAEELLAGKATGVLVSPAQGKPGQGSMVRIRGTGSLSATNSHPVVIVDGVVMKIDGRNSFRSDGILQLADINSDDIINISILTGNEATAIYGAQGANGVMVITTKSGLDALIGIETRKNFDETAFFYPQLRTDSKGNIQFEFTSPEALTQWKLRLFAHNKKAQSGYLEKFVTTQKELMIAPNMPRFFREKDTVWITARISNLTSEAKTGSALLQLFDAIDMNPIDLKADNKINHREFQVGPNGNTTVTWKITIPEGVSGIQYKVLAISGSFTDGEENLIPVLTNNILVTESIPIWVREKTTRSYSFKGLKNNESTTLKNHQLTLEYTSNPVWLAIEALPYLLEYEHDCSEQVFARYYANTIAADILNDHPKILNYLKSKKEEGLDLKLEQNEELKSILFAETPWYFDSQSEESKRARLAALLDLEKVTVGQEANLEKLKKMQLTNGAFPWFEGGRENEYLTRHIVAGFGKLDARTKTPNPKYKTITDKAIPYLDQKFMERVGEKEKKRFRNSEIHYLYARSFYSESHPPKDSLSIIIKKELDSLKADWLDNSLYGKGMIALVSHRFGDTVTAKKIIGNLKETAALNEDAGMYWIENKNGWHWYNSAIETQALLIQAFAEIDKDPRAIDAMIIWLLKNKQTKHWPSTRSTSEAIDAILRSKTDFTQVKDQTRISMGNSSLAAEKLKKIKKEAETGYFKLTFNEEEISKDLADVTIINDSEVPGFGGFYFQYFEEAEKIEATGGKIIQVQKELYLNQSTGQPKLQKITDLNPLKLGDLVTVRLTITAKEEMEFVHLKDLRTAGFEPVNVLSEYKTVDGLRYYQSTRDAATHFFFDRIKPGVYILEYDVRTNNIGNFSNGISTIQSMYAPEFGSHSKGVRVGVGKEE